MCTSQKYTDGAGLILADFSLKSGGLNTVLDCLGAVLNTVREGDKLTVEVCSSFVCVIGDVRFALGGLAFDLTDCCINPAALLDARGCGAAASENLSDAVNSIYIFLLRC